MPLVSRLINDLLRQRLAACISYNEINSFYYWENKLENPVEIQLIIKTKKSLQNLVFNYIKKIHPYTIPELLVFPIITGDINYLKWIQKSLN